MYLHTAVVCPYHLCSWHPGLLRGTAFCHWYVPVTSGKAVRGALHMFEPSPHRSPRYQVFFMAFRGLVRRSQWHCTPAHFSHSRRFTQSRPCWFPEWSKHLWAGCCPHHFHRKWIPAEKDWRRLSGLNSSIWHCLAGILVYFTNRSKSNKHAILIHRLMGLLLRDRRFNFQGAHVQWHQFLETPT